MKALIIIPIIILFSLTISIQNAISQNLVPNPGFDTGKENAEKFIPDLWQSDFLYASYYKQCGFNGCTAYHGSGKSRNKLFSSNEKPKNGICYAGFYAYSYSDKRGYWGIQLTDTLHKGYDYTIEVFVSIYEESDIWLKEIQVLFSDSLPGFVYHNLPVNDKPYLKYSQNDQIVHLNNYNHTWLNKDTTTWIKISGTYHSKGNESFMVIGNMKKNLRTEHLCDPKHSMNDSMAYYFIDDIIVTEIPKYNISEMDINEHIVLHNIYFETDKYVLLPASFKELEKLYIFMKENPNLTIMIEGHTDNTGTDEHNLLLSKNRANAVQQFLVSKGIEESRIAYKGYGSSRPDSDNGTTEGRTENRRVEFVIVSK